VGINRTVRETAVLLVRLPAAPVMVIVPVPVVAVLFAESVKVLVLVVLPGLNEAITPLGRPVADSATLPLKPFSGLTVMVLAPLEPCVTVKVLGAAESVKVGGGPTVSETVVAFVKLPAVPVMVTLTVPVAAVLVAVRFNVLVLVVAPGLNEALTPAGRPEADKVTLLLKPFCGVTVIVLAPPAPSTMVKLFGDADSV
jgi:hypothetical protein